jgi:hypothetical protein
MDWVSAHVFYHGDLTDLVVSAVVPLAREMCRSGQAAGWFFLRYWEGGPHVRLRVLPAVSHSRDAVREMIAERVGRYLREHPSAESMRQADYARLAPVWAAGEGMAGYAASLYPNNSVVFLPYRREHDRYGCGGSVEAVERHFVDSSRLAAALLAGAGWSGRRETVAFSLLLLTWLACQPDPAKLAEAAPVLYQAWARSEAGVGEADFAERYDRQRDRLADLARGVRDVAAGLPRQDACGGVLARWGTSVVRLRDALAREVAAGRFIPPARRRGRPAPAASDDLHMRVLPVLDVCAHLVCNRLDVSLTEEAYLRYLALRATAALAEGTS